MAKYDRKKVFCLLRKCMNNEGGECGLLHAPIISHKCPFYKTKAENDAECMRLEVITWQEMETDEKSRQSES